MLRNHCIVLGIVVAGALAACSSDPTDPYTYATGNVPCTSAADCCVAYDGCKATGLVVGKADLLKVQDLIAQANAPDAGNTCVRCIPPAIEVACESSKCIGYVVPGNPTTIPEELRKDHCGPGNVPAGTMLVTKGSTLTCQ